MAQMSLGWRSGGAFAPVEKAVADFGFSEMGVNLVTCGGCRVIAELLEVLLGFRKEVGIVMVVGAVEDGL